VPRGFLVGRSVHDAAEAVGLGAAVDYLIAGSAWTTAAKPAGHRPIGVAGIRAIVRATNVPVLAIGGVSAETLPLLAGSGVAGIAAIGMFMAVDGGAAGCRAIPLDEIVHWVRARIDTTG
jgi:thiamine-phosphate pyrophosphorylase